VGYQPLDPAAANLVFQHGPGVVDL
jgi:hypothetical protein